MRYAILFALNILDGSLTAAGLGLGVIGEANPLLAWMTPTGLLVVKLVLISYFVLMLYNTRTHKMSQVGTLVLVGIYCHILILHFQWIATII